MKKIKILFLLLLIASSNFLCAQQNIGELPLPLTIWIPDDIEGLPGAARPILENKLKQIATKNEISENFYASRFVFSANVLEISKEITMTAPPMAAYSIQVTFYIGDGFEGNAFNSTYQTIKGVGNSDVKAYINALNNINTNDPNFENFVRKSKEKIINYYNSRCDLIIREAQLMANTDNYNEAIYSLMSVPENSTECWSKSIEAVGPIYQQKLNYEGHQLLQGAKIIWETGLDYNSAQKAAELLSQINPASSATNEISVLTQDISTRLYEIDQREWNYTYEKDIGLKKSMIDAARDVGVAYGENQQRRDIIYKTLW